MIDSDWIILASIVDRDDRAQLSCIPSGAFSGIARSAAHELKSLPTLTLQMAIEAFRIGMPPDDAEMASAALSSASARVVSAQEVDAHIKAISFRYSSQKITSGIRRAYFDIEEGMSPIRTWDDLKMGLSDVFVARDERSFHDIVEEMGGKVDQAIDTGWDVLRAASLDTYLMGNLLTVGGPSGGLKTTTTKRMMSAALRANPDLYGIYFSKEQPAGEIAQKFIAEETTEKYTDIISRFNGANPSFVAKIKQDIQDKEWLSRLEIIPPTDFSTPTDIASILKSRMAKGKRLIWAVDYIMQLNFGRGEYNQTIPAGLMLLKEAVHDTRSFGILVSQFLKGWNNDPKTGRESLVLPQRQNLIWSSELINVSAYILLLLRPHSIVPTIPSSYFYIKFDKLRFRDSLAVAQSVFDGEYQDFRLPGPTEATGLEAVLKSIRK